ncbi:MAG: Na/Pi cotransporter family protein [Campylobacterales bacterium]|nr:Na/Pi cotransporter family protein [Campylobacterales bacterium]
MSKNIFFPLTLILLAYGFYKSADFQAISAGIAIFLFGMLSLEQGFKSFSGGILDRVLKFSTDKLYKSLLFGVVSTSIMQSSSLVSILTISFLGAGLITLAQGIGVIFGANLGTTTGAWLVAGYGLKVNIGAYAMPMLVFGTLFVFQKNSSLKGVGYILTGLGFLFLGIHYMKEGFEAFKSTIDLSAYAVGGFKGLFLFTLIGIVATVVMQSSHATLVLIITALSAGQISYENALALAIGANVGTTITAILGAMSSNIEGKRLAAAHLIFNLVTGLIAIVFIGQIVALVDWSATQLSIAHDNYTLKLAIFHTIFNTIGILVMIPFINTLVHFLEKTLQMKPSDDEIGHDNVAYLNEAALEFPQSAMGAIIRETKHLYENAFEIIAHGLNLKRGKIVSSLELEEVIKFTHSKKYIDIEDFYEKRIKDIYSDIITFSTKAQANMSPKSIENLYRLKLASRDIVEAVKNTKHLQKNIVKFSAHPNQYIKKEYALIKLSIAELLRNINIIATTDEEDVIILLLSKIRVNTQKYDIISNGKLDELIRNKHITNQMATSLMNDSVYVYNIRNKLCNMAEILFIEANSDLKHLQEELHITQEEVESLLEQKE